MPIVAPALAPLGINPVHFAIVFTHNMEIALVHAPVGPNLYVLATVSDAKAAQPPCPRVCLVGTPRRGFAHPTRACPFA
jgi:TRAP-type mannitol/chloroaromatic compound transport system permease large subunit